MVPRIFYLLPYIMNLIWKIIKNNTKFGDTNLKKVLFIAFKN